MEGHGHLRWPFRGTGRFRVDSVAMGFALVVAGLGDGSSGCILRMALLFWRTRIVQKKGTLAYVF